MRSLIVNIDDCGCSREADKRIIDYYQSGRVSGISIMPVGDSFLETTKILCRIDKRETGVHLTLTGRFAPCEADRTAVSSILDNAEHFLDSYKDFGIRYLFHRLRLGDVYNEFKAQIQKTLKAGLEITHLDSHEHIHMFPGVFNVVLELADEFKVPYIRVPIESSVVLRRGFSFIGVIRYAALQLFTRYSLRKHRACLSIGHNDFFWGHFHSERLTEERMEFILQHLAPGVNELVLHPVITDLDILTTPLWENVLHTHRIHLLSHKDAMAI